jgi:hypothetical protein
VEWLKTKVIPIITVATETISKPFRIYPSNTEGKHKIKELLKNSHIGHCTHFSENTYRRAHNI